MDKSKPKATSLRGPYNALAKTMDWMGKDEPKSLLRLQRRREATKLRELAQKEPAPKA